MPLAGRRLEALLAALAAGGPVEVSADALVDAVWGDDAPARASASLDTLVWRLRRALEPDRAAREASALVRTAAHGYRLDLPVEAVDSWRFAREAEALAAPAAALPPAVRLSLATAALELWRGRPFEQVADARHLEAARGALARQRLELERIRVDALLATGEPSRALAAIEAVLRDEPFDEPLWARRVVALRRCGRPAAAFVAVRECVELFRRELGVAPGAEVRAAADALADAEHRRVESGGPAPTANPAAAGRSPRSRVPVRRSPLVGRARELEALERALAAHALVTITGVVGCGKTRLAIAVAALVGARFADGVRFVDLSDLVAADEVAARVQSALDLPDDGGDPADRVAAALTGESALLVLDNCEHVAAGAAALVDRIQPACPGVRVLATSRRPLDLDGETVVHVGPLPPPAGASPVELAASDAAALFAQRLERDDELPGYTAAERRAIADICAAADGLPLTLELAAALSPALQLDEIARLLADDPAAPALPRVRRGSAGDRGESTVREAVEHGHALLSPIEQAVHRRLAALPSEFTLDAARAASAGEGVRADLVPHALAGLSRSSLLEALGPARPGGPSRFRQLAVIRAHASEALEARGERDDAERRLVEWMREVVRAGPSLGRAGQAARYARLDDEQRAVTAALERALGGGADDEDVLALCRLVPYWLDRLVASDPARLTALAEAAADARDSRATPVARLAARLARSAVTAAKGSLDGPETDAVERAIAELELLARDSAALVAVVDPAWRTALGELAVYLAITCWVADAQGLSDRAASGAGRLGEAFGLTDVVLCADMLAAFETLRADPAAALASSSVVVERGAGENDLVSLMACVLASIVASSGADGEAGLRWTAEELRLQARLGVRDSAGALEARGGHFVDAGRFREAVRCYAASAARRRALGRTWPHHAATAEKLARARAALPAADFEREWATGERLEEAALP